MDETKADAEAVGVDLKGNGVEEHGVESDEVVAVAVAAEEAPEEPNRSKKKIIVEEDPDADADVEQIEMKHEKTANPKRERRRPSGGGKRPPTSSNSPAAAASRKSQPQPATSRLGDPIKKKLPVMPKPLVKALPSLLKNKEIVETALSGAPIKYTHEGVEYSFHESFHVVRMEQTIGAKKRVESTMSLTDLNKVSKTHKALYKFVPHSISYVCVCNECHHPRNPLIVNPEMKRKVERRPNTRRGLPEDEQARPRSKSTGALTNRENQIPRTNSNDELSSPREIEPEAPKEGEKKEEVRASGSRTNRGKEEESPATERRSELTRNPGAQEKLKMGAATPRSSEPKATRMAMAEVFSKQNNPYEYNSYDVYIEPCACASENWSVEFLLRMEISVKAGVSVGMLFLTLPTMGVAYALYSDGPLVYANKMFGFDLLSKHEQNMSMKTVL